MHLDEMLSLVVQKFDEMVGKLLRDIAAGHGTMIYFGLDNMAVRYYSMPSGFDPSSVMPEEARKQRAVVGDLPNPAS